MTSGRTQAHSPWLNEDGVFKAWLPVVRKEGSGTRQKQVRQIVTGQKCAIPAPTADAATFVVDVQGVIDVTKEVMKRFSAVVDNCFGSEKFLVAPRLTVQVVWPMKDQGFH
jgi:hypothetical protein